MPIIVPALTGTTWLEVQQALADCIKAAAPNAEVLNEWKQGFTLDDAATLFRPQSGVDTGKLHGWMIGLSASVLYRGVNGQVPVIGGLAYDFWQVYDVWGFFGSDWATSWSKAFVECRLVAATLFTNKRVFGLADASKVKEFDPLEFFSYTEHGDGESALMLVAQGQCRVRYSEFIT